MTTSTDDTFFVPYQPPSTSKRKVEIVDAARRAYIARRWHSKQRQAEKTRLQPLDGQQSEAQRRPTNFVNTSARETGRYVLATQQAVSPVLPLPISGNALDPFESVGAIIDPDTANLLHYFELTWSPTAFQPASPKGNLEQSVQQCSSQIFRSLSTDPLVSHAFLAAIAMRMTTVHNAPSRAAFHASCALAELRLLVGYEAANSDRILLTILFLAAFETYCFNLDGTRIHLSALRYMGAHQRLDGYFKILCQHVDLFSAAAALRVPIMPQPLISSAPAYIEPVVDSGFFDAVELADSAMQDLVRRILSCAQTAELHKAQTRQGTPLQHTPQAIIAQSENLTYQLLYQLPGPPLKEACIIALLMWLSYLPVSIMTTTAAPSLDRPTPPPQPEQSYLKILPGRGTGLVNRLKAGAPLTTHLHLWILAVGVVCAIDAEDTSYCAVAFVALARQLGVDVGDVQGALRRFLWLDDFDRIDGQLLEQLLGPEEVSARALRTIAEWSRATKGQGGGRGCVDGRGGEMDVPMRITKRPSNRYRLGA